MTIPPAIDQGPPQPYSAPPPGGPPPPGHGGLPGLGQQQGQYPQAAQRVGGSGGGMAMLGGATAIGAVAAYEMCQHSDGITSAGGGAVAAAAGWAGTVGEWAGYAAESVAGGVGDVFG